MNRATVNSNTHPKPFVPRCYRPHLPMSRFCVCTSRITSGLCELQQMVDDLGGRTTTILDPSSVTHLVAGIPNATKCVEASLSSIPIVQESWVRSSWMAWKNRGGSSLTPDERNGVPLAPINDHQIPPLRGQTLTVTGMPYRSSQRRIEQLGGRFTKHMDKGETTLLVCGESITHRGKKNSL